MDDLDLLIDLHRDGTRLGPGGDAETRAAMRLAGLDRSRRLRIADIGCGTGASTLLLAAELDADVVAIDLFSDFLRSLEAGAARRGIGDRISTVQASMDDLPFADAEFDVIWSEGAIYSIGFEAGIAAWRRFLKADGVLVASEITWRTAERPHEIDEHWALEYPEIDLASNKIAMLERHGYVPEAYFMLPEHCWRDAYFDPLRKRFDAFLARHATDPQARAIVEAEEREMELYERYSAYYGYGMYIARASASG